MGRVRSGQRAINSSAYAPIATTLTQAAAAGTFAPLDARDTSITSFAVGMLVASGSTLYKVTTAHAAPFDTAKATSVGGGGGSAPDATSSVKGLVQLTGDLGGTAASPTVPRLASLADRGNWVTATAYVVGDVVTQSGIRYVCRTAHTSGTFVTDWGNAKWTQTSLSNAVTTIGLKRDFSAKGDARILTDAVVTATTTLTSATGAFTSADQGKVIAIPYAGADAGGTNARAAHLTTVASVQSATSLTLTAAPTNAVTSARTVTDAAMTNKSANLTSATANFTEADRGKKITVPGAGFLRSDGTAPLETRIDSITNSTTVVLRHMNVSGASVSAQTVIIPGPLAYLGTDDATALQAAADLGSSTGRPVEVEPGHYLTTVQVSVGSKFAWYGHGAGVSIVSPVGGTGPIGGFTQTGVSQLSDITFRDFEIDCTAAKVNTYATANKGIYLRPVDRLRIQGMYIHDTSATAIGCDWLRDSFIVNNVIDWAACQYVELNASLGGAGIGLGTGKYTQESVLIAGNSVKNAGSKGIFAESQSSTIRSRGVRIVNNYVYGSTEGIGDHATEEIVIEGNIVEFCQYGLRATFGFVSSLYSENGLMKGNVLRHSGIDITIKSGSYTVQDNVIDGGVVYGGIAVGTPASAVVECVRVIGNSVKNSSTRGISLTSAGTSWNRCIVKDNLIIDCPANRSAIYSTATINVLHVKDNVAYDSRGTKLQTYGLELASGAITRLIDDGNDFVDNLTGTELLTITPGTTISHFNP